VSGGAMADRDSGAGKPAMTPGDGDQRDFEDYFEQWSASVYRFLMHLLGSPDRVEDLFQETWLRALERRHQLQNPERFGPWILRIARNLAHNSMRKTNRKAQVWILSDLASPGAPEMEDLTERAPSPGPSPRDLAINAERCRIIQEAIGKLDLQSQELLQLRYFEHLTLAETAEVLDAPLGTVCTKVHRALRTIRDRLKRQGFSTLQEI
jgi:RNA polymerase sigma-70 factor (ECF subfamily)